ncbi:MAG: tRNA adenosine(34) deaminase TadA [Lentisphaeraceae bacterium]|nr:tRNA adenosine(34) deaminase TadA [Lentisphaeraceae bacterium]
MLDFKSDNYYMNQALRQARQADAADEVPIGAVIVKDGEVIGRAFNQVETLNDATAHAEILAITQASSKINNWRLSGSTLYVTKEPCPMCAGAIVNSRIDKVVFGLQDSNGGGCGGAFNIHNHDGLLHKYEIKGGFMELESLEIIQDFFQRRRQEKKASKKNPPLLD